MSESVDILGYSALDWLTAKMQLLGKDGIIAILAEQGIDPTLPIMELPEYDRDLLLSSCLYEQIMLSENGSAVKDVDGSWSHSEDGWKITKSDKLMWEKRYIAICRKWGIPILIPQRGIKVHSRGMRVWKR